MKNIMKSSVAVIFLFLGLCLGGCNERPGDGSGLIQHPQNHDPVMGGGGAGEGEMDAENDTLERADTLQNRSMQEGTPDRK